MHVICSPPIASYDLWTGNTGYRAEKKQHALGTRLGTNWAQSGNVQVGRRYRHSDLVPMRFLYRSNPSALRHRATRVAARWSHTCTDTFRHISSISRTDTSAPRANCELAYSTMVSCQGSC